MFTPYYDPEFLGGAYVKGICCKCGKKMDGYHIWQYQYQGEYYCDYHRPLYALRINQ